MAQNWILNKETGKYELFEEVEKQQAKSIQKALFDYNTQRIENKE